jgi:transglutaminase-like putative cysteine protease
MLIEIQHLTRYAYSAEIREGVMEARMQPRSTRRQRLVSFALTVEPRAKLYSYVDWLGNTVHHFDTPSSHSELALAARAVVETTAPEALPPALDLEEWKRLEHGEVTALNFDMLQPSAFTAMTPLLEAFLKAHDTETLVDPLTRLHKLSAAIHDGFEYEPGATKADSPIDLALKLKRGVCQDFVHIMLSAARSWGIPARYISGYLCRTADSHDRSTPDATHAWVECWLPTLGWVAFDPTNAMLAGERHVVVAVGRDYADVPPTRGVYKGEAQSRLDVAVQVKETRSARVSLDFISSVQPPKPKWSKKAVRQTAVVQVQQQQQQQQ